MTQPLRNRVADTVAQVGGLYVFAVASTAATVRSVLRGRFAWRECLDQLWFLAAVTVVPSVLVMIPFGVVVALQIGSMAAQIGAENYSGAVIALLIIGQAAPMVTALMIAGVGGSAICADLGARTIREEIDALEVMGLPTLERLVAPRLVAAMVITLLLNGLVMAAGIGASFLFQVLVADSTPGGFLATFTQFSRPADLLVGEFKAVVFAAIAAWVASYKALTVKGGPRGVGDAVNESVVLSFVAVFVANTAISQLYALLAPANGGW